MFKMGKRRVERERERKERGDKKRGYISLYKVLILPVSPRKGR